MTAPREVHLTTAKLAERWHCTPNAIRVAKSRGKAPSGSFRRGHETLWPLAQVEAFEAEQARVVQAARMSRAQVARTAA